jgi:hypothetical protein
VSLPLSSDDEGYAILETHCLSRMVKKSKVRAEFLLCTPVQKIAVDRLEPDAFRMQIDPVHNRFAYLGGLDSVT